MSARPGRAPPPNKRGLEGGKKGDGPANKKRRQRLDRAREKPGFELAAKAKGLWFVLSRKRLEKAERQRVSSELFSLIHGKLHQLAVKHDAARVVQCGLKFGTEEQREAYIEELMPHLVEFSKVQYAHFIVLRLLKVTAKGCHGPAHRARVLRALSGKALELATHAVGAKVLNGVLEEYPREETRALRSELYGREAALLLEEGARGDLAAVLSAMPERAQTVMAHMVGLIQRMLDKGVATLPFAQELIFEVTQAGGPETAHQLAPVLLDHCLLLTGTRAGCKALAECVAFGGPKERKQALKALKGYVAPTLLHQHAYLLLLRLADVMDDTVAFNKGVWGELLGKGKEGQGQEALLQVALHPKASKLLLLLLAPDKRKSFLNQDELELLREARLPRRALEGEGEGEEGGLEPVPTSKKSAEARREELLAYLQGPLLEMGRERAAELMVSPEGSFVLFETAKRWHDPELLQALAQTWASSPEVREDKTAYKLCKRLLLLEGGGRREGEAVVAKELLERTGAEELLRWTAQDESGRAGFLVEALCKVPGVGAELLQALKGSRKRLQEFAQTNKGAAAVLSLLPSGEVSTSKSKGKK